VFSYGRGTPVLITKSTQKDSPFCLTCAITKGLGSVNDTPLSLSPSVDKTRVLIHTSTHASGASLFVFLIGGIQHGFFELIQGEGHENSAHS